MNSLHVWNFTHFITLLAGFMRLEKKNVVFKARKLKKLNFGKQDDGEV